MGNIKLVTLAIIFLFGCKSKIIYNDAEIRVTKKDLKSKFLLLDSNYVYLLKHNNWKLKVILKGSKISNVDSLNCFFKTVNDSIVQIQLKSSIQRMKYIPEYYFSQGIDSFYYTDSTYWALIKDTSVCFSFQLPEKDDEYYYPIIDLYRLDKNVLILQAKLYSGNGRRKKHYRLLFRSTN